MASPYNTTDEMNSQTAGATKGTQISKTAQTSRISDANNTQDTQDTQSFDQNASSADQDSQTSAPQQQTRRQPKQQASNQSAGQSNAQSSGQATGVDVLRGSLTNAFDQIVKEIEPQINEFASNFAHQALDKGADYGRQAVQRVQKQSWGRIGLAAALIVGAVAILGYTAAEVADNDSLH